jgi:hypothetical protein
MVDAIFYIILESVIIYWPTVHIVLEGTNSENKVITMPIISLLRSWEHWYTKVHACMKNLYKSQTKNKHMELVWITSKSFQKLLEVHVRPYVIESLDSLVIF